MPPKVVQKVAAWALAASSSWRREEDVEAGDGDGDGDGDVVGDVMGRGRALRKGKSTDDGRDRQRVRTGDDLDRRPACAKVGPTARMVGVCSGCGGGDECPRPGIRRSTHPSRQGQASGGVGTLVSLV